MRLLYRAVFYRSKKGVISHSLKKNAKVRLRFTSTITPQMKQAEQQIEELVRGTEEVLPDGGLEAKLKKGKPLVVKTGFDPTAPDLHVGHTVLINKMRQFQQLGHEVVFLIGDFTGMIGDPSGKKKTRPALSSEEVEANAQTYVDQVRRVLDVDASEIRFNSEWMDAFTPTDFVKLCSQQTVARLLERDDFAKRYAAGEPGPLLAPPVRMWPRQAQP